MFVKTLEVGFYDTDAFGHISNTRLPVWFELARNDVFGLFLADRGVEPWKVPLIMARIEVDFLSELFYGFPVEVRTWVEKIGNSSFTVLQEAHQKGGLRARGRATIVHFDWKTKKSSPLPPAYREALSRHPAP